MSGEKSGDNRMFQIVMVLITSVVAPLVVFFVTNAAKNSPTSSTATASITATQPATTQSGQTTAIAGVQVTAVQTPTAQPTATQPAAVQTNTAPVKAAGIQNPTGLVPAGTAAIVDNLSLTVNPEDVVIEGGGIRVTLHVKNLGADSRTVVLTSGAVTLKDDRKIYSQMLGDKKSGCTKEDLKTNKSIEIKSGAIVTITSSQARDPETWCAPNQNNLIPAFAGPLSKGTTKLQIQINGVGPFKGFAFEVPVKN